jgi:lichenan operon transcriptional antiterminator
LESADILLGLDEYITSMDLSKKLSVSDRTIKRDISIINETLQKYDCQIISKHGEGYRIKRKDRKKITSKITEYDLYSSPQDKRLYDIAIHLLSCPDGCSLYDMEDQLFISRSTLENDLRRLRTLLSHSYPAVKIKRHHETVLLSGDEFTLRLFFNKLLHSKYSYVDQTLCIEHPDLDLLSFDAIKSRTVSIMTKYVQLHDLAIADIAAYLFITRKRLAMKQEIVLPAQTEKYIINHSEIIKTMADKLFELTILTDINCSNLQTELEHLVVKLSLMNIYIPQKMKKTDVLNDMPSRVVDLVGRILSQIDHDYRFNLSDDDELFAGLAYHISALLNRAVYPELFPKPEFTMPIKKEYPFIFEISLNIRNLMKEYTDYAIDEDDISYIAARIAASVEKHKPNYMTRRIRVAIISHYGASYTELLYETLKSTFYPIIEIVGMYYVYHSWVCGSEFS